MIRQQNSRARSSTPAGLGHREGQRCWRSYPTHYAGFKHAWSPRIVWCALQLIIVQVCIVQATMAVAQDQAGSAVPKTSASQRPDIIFLISDDQAWNDYSMMGHPHIKTPNIDQLAREGLTFTRGYVPDSLCRPSLATMISGLYPHQHGIVGNDPPSLIESGTRMGRYRSAEYQQAIEQYLKLHIDQMETLPDRLKPLGYVSYQTGKWWEGNPSRGGFDAGMTHGDPNRGGRHGDDGLDIGRGGVQPIKDFVSKARADDQPYFLWYAPFLPHAPHNPPEELLAKYLPLAPTESIAKYWAMCEWFDQSIGEVRQVVNQLGRPDNTIMVYVCDNGWINLPDKSAYAPKSKRSQYDGGIRTPIMVHWPGHVAAKRDETHLASSIDLVPTVMSLIGLPSDGSLPGIDLTNDNQVASRDTIYGEILEHDIQSMDDPKTSLLYRWVIQGNRKVIIPNLQRVTDGVVELYDLASDPWEETNLATQASSAAEVAAMKAKLDLWWRP